jgi:hypothetical protein
MYIASGGETCIANKLRRRKKAEGGTRLVIAPLIIDWRSSRTIY